MYAIRPDGVRVNLHDDGTWTEFLTANVDDHLTEYEDARWVSEYDFDRRTITLTRVQAVGTLGWRLNEIVRDENLSDPDGRFEVFVAAKDGWFRDASPIPGEIVKVTARLRNDGYLAAWRADFWEDPIICDSTLWARYMHGGFHLGRAENHNFRHWTYVSFGEILRTPTNLLRTWTEAYAQWKALRRCHPGNNVRAVLPNGISVELHCDGTWALVPTTDCDNDLTTDTDAEWVSEYDFGGRTVTLTRVLAPGTSVWPLTEIVRDAKLSDPDGRFEVFVASQEGWFGDHSPIPGEIVKVSARLDDDGYFTAWHPDFSDFIVCQPTLWGIYQGGYGPEERPKHWIYATRGHIINGRPTELRTWADAHGEWLEWQRSLRDA